MLVAKDRTLQIRQIDGAKQLSWGLKQDDRVAAFGLFGLFAILIVCCLFFPSRPSDMQLGRSMGALWLVAIFCVLSYRMTITASRERLTVHRGVLGALKVPVARIEGAPIQFYLRGRVSATSSGSLFAMDANHHEILLAPRLPASALPLQLWTELQDFYDLEDLEVLGELGRDSFRTPGPVIRAARKSDEEL